MKNIILQSLNIFTCANDIYPKENVTFIHKSDTFR